MSVKRNDIVAVVAQRSEQDRTSQDLLSAYKTFYNLPFCQSLSLSLSLSLRRALSFTFFVGVRITINKL